MRIGQLALGVIAIFGSQLAAQVSQVQLDTGRPLAKAAEQLERRYGWVVTYEDVPAFGADTRDVTEQVSRVPNPAQRTIVPKAQPFAFLLDEGQAQQPGQVGEGAVIAELLHAYNQSGNPGKFQGIAVRAKNGPLILHLVPQEMRDEQGQSKPYKPLLDTRITVPSGQRSLDRILSAIDTALEEITGKRFVYAAIASNYLMQTQVEGGADNEVARDVLRRVLIEETGRSLSWHMFCDPGGKLCSLNVHDAGAGRSSQ